MAKGYLALVLHAHLPYVRHPEYDSYMEESWLFEAISETYIPLLRVLENCTADGVDFRLTMSLTPPLVSMLTDELLQQRFEKHLEGLIELGKREIWRTRKDPEFQQLARMYLQHFEQSYDFYVNQCRRNLVPRFAALQRTGKLEIITCAATHAFLPLVSNPKVRRAQVQFAAEHYRAHFGQSANGIWLPECGYAPGVEDDLKAAGIRYFFLDTHGLLYSEPRPRFGVFAPIYMENRVSAFGRDMESSKQVWSAREGYPGDFDYRDFYRDIGFDLDFDYIKDFIHPDGIRTHTGYKYFRITGRSAHKEPYHPDWAREKAASHAGNFLFNRHQQVEHLQQFIDRPPIIVAPYDAELFGHWWFEGPAWIDFLFRKMHHDQDSLELMTPSQYLQRHPINQVCQPTMSSWGYKGYNEVWLEQSNDWIYKHLLTCADRMCELAGRFAHPDPLQRRALNQAGRELFLAQASDWAFIMKSGTTVPDAAKRTIDHVHRFNQLYDSLSQNEVGETWLKQYEEVDNLFPDMDYRLFQ